MMRRPRRAAGCAARQAPASGKEGRQGSSGGAQARARWPPRAAGRGNSRRAQSPFYVPPRGGLTGGHTPRRVLRNQRRACVAAVLRARAVAAARATTACASSGVRARTMRCGSAEARRMRSRTRPRARSRRLCRLTQRARTVASRLAAKTAAKSGMVMRFIQPGSTACVANRDVAELLRQVATSAASGPGIHARGKRMRQRSPAGRAGAGTRNRIAQVC